MSKSYATILQNLCHEYMNHGINFEEYRRKRRVLLLKIDEQFNGYRETETASIDPAHGQSSLGASGHNPSTNTGYTDTGLGIQDTGISDLTSPGMSVGEFGVFPPFGSSHNKDN